MHFHTTTNASTLRTKYTTYLVGGITILALMLSAVSPEQAIAAGQPTPEVPGVTVFNAKNFAGYVMATSNGVQTLEGMFVLPKASCPKSGAQATQWLGITSSSTSGKATIEQAGVLEECNASKLTYLSFVEMAPSPSNALPLNGKAGDTIDVKIAFEGGREFRLSVIDAATNSGQSVPMTCPTGQTCSRGFGEAIVERLLRKRKSAPAIPLPKLGLVTFRHLLVVTDKGDQHPLTYFETHHALSRFDMHRYSGGKGPKLFNDSSPDGKSEGFTVRQLLRG